MAEPTQQDIVKNNQSLTSIEKSTSETSGKIDDLISAVKQPATYETDLLKEIKEQGEDRLDTDKKSLKSNKALHEDIKELTKNSSLEKVHNKFMQGMEKRKHALALQALKDKQREDKLRTREDGKFGKFVERKWDSFKKDAGSWLSNIGKLLALVGGWALLQWLKGRDL